MKQIILTFGIVAFLALNTVFAQSAAALRTQSGRYLWMDKGAIPASNEVTAAQMSSVATLVILDDSKLLPAEGVTVTSFRLTIVRKPSNLEITSTDGTVTTEMQKELAGVKTGDRVYFEYITGKRSDGTEVKPSALDFKIVQ